MARNIWDYNEIVRSFSYLKKMEELNRERRCRKAPKWVVNEFMCRLSGIALQGEFDAEGLADLMDWMGDNFKGMRGDARFWLVFIAVSNMMKQSEGVGIRKANRKLVPLFYHCAFADVS